MDDFATYDRKLLYDATAFVSIISLLIYSVNFKLDILTSVPISIFAMVKSIQMAFDPENNNVDCYLEPEAHVSDKSAKWMAFLLIVVFTVY